MKSLALLSTRPIQGKTTIAVNLAAGFVKAGWKVLLIESGDPALLNPWFDITDRPYTDEEFKIRTNMDFDIVYRSSPVINQDDNRKYDYIIIDTDADFSPDIMMLDNIDILAACTNLGSEEADLLPGLDKKIFAATNDKRSIGLVIPTMINTKEWSDNTEVLFELMDYFGEDKIADMIPE